MAKVGSIDSSYQTIQLTESTDATILRDVVLDRAVPHQRLCHPALPKTVQHQHEKTQDVMRYPRRGLWSVVLGIHPGTHHQL